MGKTYSAAKGRGDNSQYFGLPHRLIHTKKYKTLSSHAVKLMVDIGVQYHGFNNGDLCIAWKLMKEMGWKSRSTLYKAKVELLKAGFIMVTRQGGRNRATLYAITWKGIDDCKGKLDVSSTTIAPGGWNDLTG